MDLTPKTINTLTIYKLVKEGLRIAIVPTGLQYGYQENVKFIEMTHIPQRTELYMTSIIPKSVFPIFELVHPMEQEVSVL